MIFTPSHEHVLMSLFAKWAEAHPDLVCLDTEDDVIKSFALFEAGFDSAIKLFQQQILSSETEFLRHLPKP